jgi:hypothetical protein
LLVFELAEIEQTAYRGLSGMGYFHQVGIPFSGDLEGISYTQHTELLTVFTDYSDLFSPNPLVDSIISNYTRYLPGISFYLL